MTEIPSLNTEYPIDIVIAWVDGNSPELRNKREQYLSESERTSPNGALPTFFSSSNEIRYCVLSILKFAPFVRNIFIITDGQDPNISHEVKLHFPDRTNSIKIIDHKEIFRGYERFLPTFNATSINSMIWRVKGLSENFVYFNDDFFLIRDIKPEDWFMNGRPVLRGRWKLAPYRKIISDHLKIMINRVILGDKDYRPRLSFYLRQWNAAKLLGMKLRYFFHCHTPYALRISTLNNFFSNNESLLSNNISPPFRTHSQFIATALANHLEILNGNRNFAEINLGYIHPYYSYRQISKRLKRCEKDSRVKSVCIQSLDTFSNEQQQKILGWMNRVLDL